MALHPGRTRLGGCRVPQTVVNQPHGEMKRMNDAKFTKGPWILHPECFPDAGGYEEPRVFSHADPDSPKIIADIAVRNNHEANGALIAAAPDMYAALEASRVMLKIMLSCWGNTSTNDMGKFRNISGSGTLKEVEAALAKAVNL